MALQAQNVAFRFAQGVDRKSDPLSVVPGKLLALTNATLVAPNELQKLHGFTSLERGIAYLPGIRLGQSVADGGFGAAQALATYRRELVSFDAAGLAYSYDTVGKQWIPKGSASSIHVAKESVSAANFDAFGADSATHVASGLQAFVWNGSDGTTDYLYYSIIDGTTGQSVVASRVVIAGGTLGRVIVVNNVFVFYFYRASTGQLYGATLPIGDATKTLTPVALTGVASDANAIAADYPVYDVVLIGTGSVGQQVYLTFNNRVGGYGTSLWRYAAANPLTVVTKVAIAGERARLLTVFEDLHLNRVVLLYWNGSAVLFRTYEPILNDASNVAQIVAFGVVETTATCTSLTGASDSAAATSVWFFYTVTTTNAAAAGPLSTVRFAAVTGEYTVDPMFFMSGMPWCEISVDPSDFLRSVALAGKAFLANAQLYVPLVFDELTQYGTGGQTTYFLADYNRNVVARVLAGAAGGDPSALSPMLPNVCAADTDQAFRIAWLQQNASGVIDNPISGVVSITFDFFDPTDSYLRAELAQTLHVGGGFLSMYDGVRFVEHNFFLYPEAPYITSAQAPNHTYQYVAVYEWTDNNGQTYQSAPSAAVTVTTAATIGSGGGHPSCIMQLSTLRLTAKRADTVINVRAPPRIAVYRTEDGGTNFLRTAGSMGTGAVVNDPTVDYVQYVDTTNDAGLGAQLYTTGGVVDNDCAPACSSVAAHVNRLMVLDDEDLLTWWFSKVIQPGDAGQSGAPVEFSQSFVFKINARGGDCTAGASLSDTTFVAFKSHSIEYVTGQGPTDAGESNDFSPSQLVTTDCGCTNPRSIVMTPFGLMFKGAKGIYLLMRDLSVTYIGADVEAYNGATVTSAVLLESVNQVRFTLDTGIALVYDYSVAAITGDPRSGQWCVRTNVNAVDSVIWGGEHTYIRSDGITRQEDPDSFTDDGAHIPLALTTSWLQFAGVQGYQRLRNMLVLGTYRGPHKLRISVAYDFNPAIVQTALITPVAPAAYGVDTPYGAGTPYGGEFPIYQWLLSFSRQKTDAVQITLTDVPNGAPCESMSLSALTFEVASKGRAKPISAAHSK